MEVPEYFVESVQIRSGPGGVAMALGEELHPAVGMGTKIHCILRMDLIQAKVLAIQLRKNLKTHEDMHGRVNLSPKGMEALGISEQEDWI